MWLSPASCSVGGLGHSSVGRQGRTRRGKLASIWNFSGLSFKENKKSWITWEKSTGITASWGSSGTAGPHPWHLVGERLPSLHHHCLVDTRQPFSQRGWNQTCHREPGKSRNCFWLFLHHNLIGSNKSLGFAGDEKKNFFSFFPLISGRTRPEDTLLTQEQLYLLRLSAKVTIWQSATEPKLCQATWRISCPSFTLGSPPALPQAHRQ